MADVPLALLPHTVTAEPKLGDSGYEASYGPPRPVRCMRRGETTMLADGTVVDPVTILCRRGDAASLNVGARVAWRGAGGDVVAYVKAAADNSDGGLGAWQNWLVTVQ